MVAEERMGLGQPQAHGRFERSAVDSVPEDLVKQTEVAPERVVCLVSTDTQPAEQKEVTSSNSAHDRGFDPVLQDWTRGSGGQANSR